MCWPQSQHRNAAGGRAGRPAKAPVLRAALACLVRAAGMCFLLGEGLDAPCAHRPFLPPPPTPHGRLPSDSPAHGACRASPGGPKRVTLTAGGPHASFISAASVTCLHMLRVY